MQLRPNKTKITATILTSVREDQSFDIVILSIPGKIVLPAFLWAGKIVNIQKQISESKTPLKEGQIISAKIEVLGDPMIQKYLLHEIEPLQQEEE